MARNQKRWEFTARSDDGMPFVLRVAQQYATMPQYGLVVGVFQRTTGSGYSVLIKPCCVIELRNLVDTLLPTQADKTTKWTYREHDHHYAGQLQITNTPEGLTFQVRRGTYYLKTSGTALVNDDTATELRDALTGWLNQTEVAGR